MYHPLCPCSACGRHVRAGEAACPFCRAALPADFSSRARPAVTGWRTRNAALALGATLGLGACSSAVTNSDAAVDARDVVAADVVARDTLPLDTSTTDVATADVVDASPRDVPDDDGAIFAMYGLPPPVDASRDVVDEKGGVVPLYGAPPPPPPPDAGR